MDAAAIPLNDLGPRFSRHAEQLTAAFRGVLDSGWVVLGPQVEQFEVGFASAVGVDHCVGVASGTDALELCLRALGAGPPSRVATVANAGLYTTTAIGAVGAEPLFLDVDPATAVVPLAEVDRAIELGVDIVVVTHLYGRLVPAIDRMVERCAAAGVALVEDCAQAHGARAGAAAGATAAGSFGHAAAFSFYPTKNLGALGDGGAVCTGDAEVAERVRSLRQYGWADKYTAVRAGGRNSRLDELQAAFLNVLLPSLDDQNARRREICATYRAAIDHPLVEVLEVAGPDHAAHLAVVVVDDDRDGLRRHLRAAGVGTDVHYPVPDHRQPVFGDRFADVSLPVTERLCRRVLSLPCHPDLGTDAVERVADLVNRWCPSPPADPLAPAAEATDG